MAPFNVLNREGLIRNYQEAFTYQTSPADVTACSRDSHCCQNGYSRFLWCHTSTGRCLAKVGASGVALFCKELIGVIVPIVGASHAQSMHHSTHVPFNTCTIQPMHHSTPAPFNTCTIQRMHRSTHAPFNTCTIQHMHHLTHALFNAGTIQHMHHSTHAPFNTCTIQHMHHSTHAPFNACTIHSTQQQGEGGRQP